MKSKRLATADLNDSLFIVTQEEQVVQKIKKIYILKFYNLYTDGRKGKREEHKFKREEDD